MGGGRQTGRSQRNGEGEQCRRQQRIHGVEMPRWRARVGVGGGVGRLLCAGGDMAAAERATRGPTREAEMRSGRGRARLAEWGAERAGGREQQRREEQKAVTVAGWDTSALSGLVAVHTAKQPLSNLSSGSRDVPHRLQQAAALRERRRLGDFLV
ncbi:hypothetical protein U9M48_043895 [Paspalum notatum var. saurae]|uniref:Uncharacterized protein n=1 Tax=Paspalum notatum var. saurae TaxID=547442 RepID=A0AAQ3UXU5_PASNO